MIMQENFNTNLEQKSGRLPPPLPPPTPQKNQIWILCQNSLTRELKIRVVGFVLKKLLTYFAGIAGRNTLPLSTSCLGELKILEMCP